MVHGHIEDERPIMAWVHWAHYRDSRQKIKHTNYAMCRAPITHKQIGTGQTIYNTPPRSSLCITNNRIMHFYIQKIVTLWAHKA